MITKEVYDKDAGWEETTIFEQHEIVALQMAGVPDDDIESLFPELSINEEKLDSRYGKFTFETYNERKRQAKEQLAKFWRRDTEDNLIQLVRENKAIYWIETSATLSNVFKKCGAIALPCTMVKYLLNKNVTPSRDGIRYMHPTQELANHSAWKTIYLLPSLSVIDAAYIEIGGQEKYEMSNAEDASKVVSTIYEYTAEPQVYERFDNFSSAMRRASWILKNSEDRSITNSMKAMLLNEIDWYLQHYADLEIHPIPHKYLNTIEDEYGVLFDEMKKRIVGLNKDKFKRSSYQVPSSVEYIDSNVFCCQKNLKQIDLSNVRIIGDNEFLQSGLEELTIPSSVEQMGGCLCEGAKSLKKVNLKDSHLEYLDIADFNGCSSLSEVILGDDLIGLSDNVFANTPALESIQLNGGIRYLGGECFMSSRLKSIALPSSVMQVADDCFLNDEDIEVKAECLPNYRTLPVSVLKHPMPAWFFIEQFQQCWILQLLRYFSYIVESNTSGNRLHELDYYKSELTKCLTWLNKIEIEAAFPYYTLTTALTTKDTGCYDSVYLYLSVDLAMHLEDWTISIKNKLGISHLFRTKLQEMYELIENGTTEDIDKFVEDLSVFEKIDNATALSFIDDCKQHLYYNPFDPKLLEKQEIPYKELLREMNVRYSPVLIPLTSAWSNGPSITTTVSDVKGIINDFRQFIDNNFEGKHVDQLLKELDTAENLHDSIMKNYAMYHDVFEGNWYPRVLPTPEQASDYINCMTSLKRFYEGYKIGVSQEEADEMERRVEEYGALSLDMRDVLFVKNGKVGLKNLHGDILVPPLFDDIPERYDCIDCRWGTPAICIPVVKDGRYSLYLMNRGKKEGKILTKRTYDRIYRYFSLSTPYYICEQDGKIGLLSPTMGREVIPCAMDNIYESLDFDGSVLFSKIVKNAQGVDEVKYGLMFGDVATDPIYDDVILQSEDYVRVHRNNHWYWLDENGKETDEEPDDKDFAGYFGSWVDISK